MTCFEPVHDHDRHCWWDHLRCGWVCPPAQPTPEPEPLPDAPAQQFVTSGAATR